MLKPRNYVQIYTMYTPMTPAQEATQAQLAPSDGKASRKWVEGHLVCQASLERKENDITPSQSAL